MELLINPTSKSNQQIFRVNDVKDYKFIGYYTVAVEFNNGDKESFYSIDSVEVIENTPKFESHLVEDFYDYFLTVDDDSYVSINRVVLAP